MFKNSYKFLFFFTLIIGSLIAMSSTSWISIWMGLEINLLSFIPLMMSSKNLFSTESSLKYFLIQALASTVFLFSILMFFLFLKLKFYTINENFMIMLISSTMLMKMGAAPFHFWFPSVMEGLTWMSNLILMTWQKITPLMILSYCLSMDLLVFVIILSAVFGSLGGLNQTSLRKLMAFSSINHLSWMLAGTLYNEIFWFYYFILYSILSMVIVIMFYSFKMININQMFNLFNSNLFMKLLLFIPLLSLGGLPPFLGFFPKWIIIEMMLFFKMNFILMIILFLTLITLYFYLRISYSALLMKYTEMNWNFKNNYLNNSVKTLIFMNFISIFGLVLINFSYLFF